MDKRKETYEYLSKRIHDLYAGTAVYEELRKALDKWFATAKF